jgi:hypothetical protein
MQNEPIYFVSCVGQKLNNAVAAKDLYQSDWFLKARSYIESVNPPRWYILSAKYGLLDSNQIIEPYNKTLNTMKIQDRRLWAKRVLFQLNFFDVFDVSMSIVFLAGKRYREFLIPPLERMGCHIDVPMKGLGIGKQLRWLTKNTMTNGVA